MNDYKNLPASILALSPAANTLDVEVVSNEAMSFSTMKTHFNDVNAKAKSILGMISPKDGDFKIVSISLKDILLTKGVLETGYMPLRDTSVYKPSGFTGNILEFVTMLEKLSPNIIQMTDHLTKFEVVLGRMVSHPKDLSKAFTGIKPVKLPNGETTLESFQDFFMGKSGIDSVKLKNAYGSLGEVEKAGQVLLKLTEQFNGEDIIGVRTRGDNLYTTLEYLEEELEDKGLVMSKSWRKAIGAELYLLTQWLGIYALFITKLVSVSVSHRDTVARLNTL